MHLTRTIAVPLVSLLAFAAVACSSDDSDDGSDDSGAAGTSTTEATDATDVGGDGDGDGTVAPGDGEPETTLPDGWPDALALPAGTTLLEATQMSDTSMSATARIDGDAQEVFDELEAQLTDAGFEIVASTFTPSDQGGFGSISAAGPNHTAAIAFGPDPTGDTSQVTINVAEVAP